MPSVSFSMRLTRVSGFFNKGERMFMPKHWELKTALSATAFSVLGSLASAQPAMLSVDPTTQTTLTGTVVTVDVDIANVSNLYGYQFDLTFNPSILQAVSSSEGSFLAVGGGTFFVNGSNDNVGGTVSATADTLLSAVNGVGGSGELAVFTFDAIGTGTSGLSIQNETLLDADFNILSDKTTSGSVAVGSGVVAAPEIDPASAASALTLLFGGLAVLLNRKSKLRG
jgi:hypothetical protein